MDEYYRGNRKWIGLGALAIIFLCVMLCGMGTLAMLVTRSGPAYAPVPYVQPSAGEDGVAPPPAYYSGYGPMGRFGHFSPFGFLFKMLFFGLLLLLFIGLITRIFFGRRHWGFHYGPRPPKGKEWKGRPHGPVGPWHWWHCHGWEEKARPSDEESQQEGEPDTAGATPSEAA